MWAKHRVVTKTNGVVVSGPLKNTQLANRHVFGSHIPKLLGSYELEIQPLLQSYIDDQPTVVCNIGGAEGYYAVGCARQASVKKAIVYEGLALGQQLINLNAKTNDVSDKIDIRGLCDEAALHALLNDCTVDLMLIDIEGAELDILSARNVKALRNTNMIIESHDFCRPNCIELLTKRLENSHQVDIIESRPRQSDDVGSVFGVPKFVMRKLIDEQRPGVMLWAGCTPKETKKTVNKGAEVD